MQLTPGSRLGPYEISSSLGAGGMGEVYLAKDTRLHRSVAVKTLPQIATGGTEQKLRFKREAEALAAINHPRICTLHDVGEHSGIPFLVMEFVEGTTLEAKLRSGPLPLGEALRYGLEIADGLAHAHRAGIIHRDLKPSNIMLTRNGVKILDFGLAKIPIGLAGDMAATRTQSVTTEGHIAGTLSYMSPEQLEGRELDARSDIFAFGAVLYEMLTGRRTFAASSAASVIGAIMTCAPAPTSSLQPLIPAAVDRAVLKCLTKDPDARWQTAIDLRDELRWLEQNLAAPAATTVQARNHTTWQAIAAAAGLLTLISLVVTWRLLTAKEAPSPIHFAVAAPFGSFTDRSLPASISPDGRKLAFFAPDQTGRSLIWIRSVDSLAVTPFRGTENALFLFWSPDSRYVAFTDPARIKKVAIDSATVEVIAPYKGFVAGATWGPSGTILAGSVSSRLYRVPATGGTLAELRVSEERPAMYDPQFLPDGSRFLYNVTEPDGRVSVFVASLDSPAARKVVQADSQVQMISIPKRNLFGGADYYLVFRSGAKTLLQAFDPGKATLLGEPHAITERVRTHPMRPYLFAKFSPAGAMVYQTGSDSSGGLAFWDAKGASVVDLARPGESYSPVLSPAGDHLLVGWRDRQEDNQDLWSYDVARRTWSRLTIDGGWEGSPVWSPDGNQIAFSSLKNGTAGLYIQPSAGRSLPRRITEDNKLRHPTDWSRDGKYLLATEESSTAPRLAQVLVPLDGSKPRRLHQTQFAERHGQFCPSASDWVAYASNESGREEIYIDTLSGRGARMQLSNSGGSEPRWRGDGRELYYLGPGNNVMAIQISIEPKRARASAPAVLFQGPETRTLNFGHNYDVTADGKRFVFAYLLAEEVPGEVNIVLNWRPPAITGKLSTE